MGLFADYVTVKILTFDLVSEDQTVCCEIVSSIYNNEATPRRSQKKKKKWSPKHDLNNVIPSWQANMDEGLSHDPTPRWTTGKW